MATIHLTANEVNELLDAAEVAWNKARPSARKVTFVWHGKRYVSTLSSLRMLVDTEDGQPVACRYHD
jgi:hypothetical protein